MARSVPDQSEEAQIQEPIQSDHEPEGPVGPSDRLQHPVDAADRPRNQNRPSLMAEEPDFEYLYFQESYQKDPRRLFDRILTALQRRDEAEEKVKNHDNEALEQRRDMAELLIENENLKAELLSTLRQNQNQNSRQTTPEAPTTKKSTKLTDPPVLTDRIDPEFTDWLS